MDTLSAGERLEGWLRLYEEQIEHLRHHENMRAQATNIVIAISAAILALLASMDVSAPERSNVSMYVGATIVVVNLYGLLMTWKHYERALQCAEKASAYREIVSGFISTPDKNFETIRKSAEAKHEKNLNMLQACVRVHHLWPFLHLLIVIIGAAIFLNGYCS